MPEEIYKLRSDLLSALKKSEELSGLQYSDVHEHLRLITGGENEPVLLWSRDERESEDERNKKKESLTVVCEDEEKIISFVDERNRLSKAVYVALAIPNLESLREKGFKWSEKRKCWYSNLRNKSEDAGHFNVLVLDLDYNKKEEGKRIVKINEEDVDKILRFLAHLYEKGIDFGLAFSGGGFHIYIPLATPLKPKEWQKLEIRLIEYARSFGLPVDGQVKDLARVMRLIGTYNFKYDRPRVSFWIRTAQMPTFVSTLEELLPKPPSRSPKATKSANKPIRNALARKKVDGEELVRAIIELLPPADEVANGSITVPDPVDPTKAISTARSFIIKDVAYLMARAGVERELAYRLVEEWVGESRRANEIKRNQVDDQYKVYERGGQRKEVADRSAAGSLARQIYAWLVHRGAEQEEAWREARKRVAQILSLLGLSGEYEILRGVKATYLIDYDEKKVVILSKKKREAMLGGVVKRMVRIADSEQYYVELVNDAHEGSFLGELNDVASAIADSEFALLSKSQLKPYLNDFLMAYIQKKGTEVVPGLWPGVYYVNGEFVVHDVEKPNKEELRKSVELLLRLEKFYRGELNDVFWTVLKWGIVAPLYYALRKRYNESVPALVLYGNTSAGKSTLARIIVWSTGGEEVNADTHASLGYVLERGLAPVLIDEAERILSKANEDPKMMSLLKRWFSEQSRVIARSNLKLREVEARRVAIMTTNEEFDALPQIARRMFAIGFPSKKLRGSKEFNKLLQEVKAGGLMPIFRYALHIFIERKMWKAFESHGWKELAEGILLAAMVDSRVWKDLKELLVITDKAKKWAEEGDEEERMKDTIIVKVLNVITEDVAEERRAFETAESKFVKCGEDGLYLVKVAALLRKAGVQMTPEAFAEYFGGEYFKRKVIDGIKYRSVVRLAEGTELWSELVERFPCRRRDDWVALNVAKYVVEALKEYGSVDWRDLSWGLTCRGNDCLPVKELHKIAKRYVDYPVEERYLHYVLLKLARAGIVDLTISDVRLSGCGGYLEIGSAKLKKDVSPEELNNLFSEHPMIELSGE